MILRLSLLLCVAVADDGLPTRFDVTRCIANHATCATRQSCLSNSKKLLEENLQVFKKSSALSGDCDFFISIIKFSDALWQVSIEVTEGMLDISEGIQYIFGKDYINCNEKGIEHRGVKAYEYGSGYKTMNGNLMFCSMLWKNENIGKILRSKGGGYISFKRSNEIFKLNIGNLIDEAYKYSFCNSGLINKGLKIEGDRKQVDVTSLAFECTTDYKMHVFAPNSDIAIIADSFGCEKGSKSPKYFYKKGKEKQNIAEGSIIYCEQTYCNLCKALHSDVKCPNCKAPSKRTSDGCEEFYCNEEENQKLLHNRGTISIGVVLCRKSQRSEGVNWFVVTNSKETEVDASGATCVKVRNCAQHSKLIKHGPSKVKLDPDGMTYRCENAGDTLWFGLKEPYTKAKNNKIVCNEIEGLFYSDKTSVKEKSNLYCTSPGAEPLAFEQKSNHGTTIGIISAVVIPIILIIFLVLWLKKRRRKELPRTEMMASSDPKTALIYASKENKMATSDAPVSTVSETTKDAKSDGMKTAIPLEVKQDKTEEMQLKTAVPLRTLNFEKIRSAILAKEQASGKYGTLRTAKMKTKSDDLKKPGDRLNTWTENSFEKEIAPFFPQYSNADRISCMQNLTSFQHYRADKPETEFGTLEQLFRIIKECLLWKLLHGDFWDAILRLFRMFYCRLPDDEISKDVKKRLKELIRTIGKFLVAEVGLRKKEGEDPKNLQLRKIALRMLWWVEDAHGIEELNRLSSTDFTTIEPPVRQVILSYVAIRQNGREKLLKLFREECKKTKICPKQRPEFADMRQHLIYALCTGSVEGMKEVLTIMNEKDNANKLADFTPTDLLFAFKGAVENPANFEKVVELFESNADPNFEEALDAIMEKAEMTKPEKKSMDEAFKKDILDLCNLLADHCVTAAQHKSVYGTCATYLMYAVKPGKNDFDVKKHSERASNLEALFKQKKCSELFDKAMKDSKY